MPNAVVSFEIRGRDAGLLREFYAEAFAWQIEALPGGYAIVETVQHSHEEGAMRFVGDDSYMNSGVVLGSAYGQPAWKFAGEPSWRGFAPGIDGGVGEGTPGVSIYVQVPDLEATLNRVVALGGQVAQQPVEVAPNVVVAAFSDPEGNRIGLIRAQR